MKLLIVDDERLVRDGIKCAIPWEQEGIDTVVEAEDGRSALLKTMQIGPDIVICDIHMPKMDGIAFIKELKALRPETAIIMLTAFAEKEYMLEAIRCGVSDFLLKPAGLDQILRTVRKAIQDIRQERSRQILLKQRSDLLEENASLFHEYYLSAFLEGRLSVEKLEEGVRLLRIPLDGPFFSVLLAQPAPQRQWHLVQMLSGLLAAYAPVMTRLADRVAVVLNLPQAGDLEQIEALLQSKRSDLTGQLTGSLLLSRCADEMRELSGLYREAAALFPRCIRAESGGVINVASATLPDVDPARIDTVVDELFRGLSDEEQAEAVAGRCYDDLAAMLLPQDLYENCLTRIARRLERRSGRPVGELNAQTDRELFVRRLCQKDAQTDWGGGHAGRALRYLQTHYRQELQLEDLAKALYLSPSYLSRVLREKGDRGFIGWLRYFRIEKAKSLLRTSSLKNYEVAEQVGYRSYKVFSEHFQKETGLSVGQWKKTHPNVTTESGMDKKEDY